MQLNLVVMIKKISIILMFILSLVFVSNSVYSSFEEIDREYYVTGTGADDNSDSFSMDFTISSIGGNSAFTTVPFRRGSGCGLPCTFTVEIRSLTNSSQLLASNVFTQTSGFQDNIPFLPENYTRLFNDDEQIRVSWIGTGDSFRRSLSSATESFSGTLFSSSNQRYMKPTVTDINFTLVQYDLVSNIDISSFTPNNSTSYNWDQDIIALNLETNLDSTCNYIYNSNNVTFTTTGGTVHNSNLNIGNAFNETIDHEITYRCVNDENPSDVKLIDVIFEQTSKPFNVTLVDVSPGLNVTFDVEEITIEVLTSYDDATCILDDSQDQFNFTTSNNELHTINYNLGSATTSPKEFDLDVICSSPSSLSNANLTTIEIYQQAEPLLLEIQVPQDQQTFTSDTDLITFLIETNYMATCSYLVLNMSDYVNFTNTGGTIHTTNYTAFYPETLIYPTSFRCDGTIIDELVELNVTFILSEAIVPSTPNNESQTLITVTNQLPQVGTDISQMLYNLSQPFAGFLLDIGKVIIVIALFFVIISAKILIIQRLSQRKEK